MRKRIRNLIDKFVNGEELYTNMSPRISYDEINEIEKLVGLLQVESLHGAEAGSPRVVYALELEKFRAKAKELK